MQDPTYFFSKAREWRDRSVAATAAEERLHCQKIATLYERVAGHMARTGEGVVNPFAAPMEGRPPADR